MCCFWENGTTYDNYALLIMQLVGFVRTEHAYRNKAAPLRERNTLLIYCCHFRDILIILLPFLL